MAWQFRAANEADFAAICGLLPTQEELFRVYPRGTYPFSIDQLKHLFETRKAHTVATDAGKITGFANLYDFNNRCAFLGNVVVDKAYRGQGLGKCLVEYMIEQAFSGYDLDDVHLSVFSDNTPALLLYSSLGFKPYAIEERLNYAAKRVALLHMQCNKAEYNKKVIQFADSITGIEIA